MDRRAALWLMLLALLFAAALRLPSLVDIPPGLHYDEAANGILAGDIGLRGERPVFIPSYTGKEPFYFYLAGGMMRLLGESVYSLRLTSAMIGLLTVAATYWLGKALFGDRRMALLAAVFLSVSFWHVLFSRLGFRAISQPLLQAFTVAALYQGIRRDSYGWLILGGVALGLSAYTYLAVRLFPVPLFLALLLLLISSKYPARRFRQLLVFAAPGLVVILPLLIYFLSHPDAFWVRIEQVLPDQEGTATLFSGYLKSLGMFFLEGDPYWRFNIPGRPLFDWFLALLLVSGWLISLYRLFRSRNAIARSAYFLLILTPLFMLLPTALAVGEIVPSNLRAIGLLPFLYFLPAIALDSVLKLLQRQLAGPLEGLFSIRPSLTVHRLETIIAIGIVILLLVLSGAGTARAYFQQWSTREDLYYDSDADLAAVSTFLDELEESGQIIFLAAQHYRHPTVAFLSDRFDELKWLPNSDAIVYPEEGPVLYIFPKNSPAPDWMLPFLASAAKEEGPTGPDGQALFVTYRFANPPAIAVEDQSIANFENTITLLDYEIGDEASDEILPLTLYWRVETVNSPNLQPFVHLEDAWGYRWSQEESFAYPAEQWNPGDVVIQQVELPLRAGMPPGNYTLRVGFFDSATGKQLSRIDEQGRYAGNAFVVEGVPVEVVAYPVMAPEPPHNLNAAVGQNLVLEGYERAGETITTGEDLWLALWWQATGSLDPMAMRIELVGADNTGPILSNSSQPVHDTFPFDLWSTPRFVIDHQSVQVPDGVGPGEYMIRLRMLDEGDKTITTADLGMLTVQESERLYDPPDTTYPTAAVFGNEIELLGYDLEQEGPRRFKLRLVWQALREPSNSYTVFVHLLDLDGSCCIWQADAQPVQGTYPTDGWVAGEVVVDEYDIILPLEAAAGQYPLEIGFYLPETGTRLLVDVPGQRQRDALYPTRPVVVE